MTVRFEVLFAETLSCSGLSQMFFLLRPRNQTVPQVDNVCAVNAIYASSVLRRVLFYLPNKVNALPSKP
jgi:hypothetical protein